MFHSYHALKQHSPKHFTMKPTPLFHKFRLSDCGPVKAKAKSPYYTVWQTNFGDNKWGLWLRSKDDEDEKGEVHSFEDPDGYKMIATKYGSLSPVNSRIEVGTIEKCKAYKIGEVAKSVLAFQVSTADSESTPDDRAKRWMEGVKRKLVQEGIMEWAIFILESPASS